MSERRSESTGYKTMTDREKIASLIDEHVIPVSMSDSWLEGQEEAADAILAALSEGEAVQGVVGEIGHLRDVFMSAPKAGEPDVTGDWYAIHPDLMASGMDAVRSIRKSLSPIRGWREIESAPKDGTRVLLFVPPYGPSTGHYVNGSRWDVGGKRLLPPRWAVHSCLNDEAQPTHWMPLPPPPIDGEV